MSTAEPTDVEQLRSELQSLKQQLSSEKRARSARTRGIISWILVVLAVLATVVALLSIWTFRTLNDTDLFVDRVGSIIEEPAVAQAVGDEAAAQLVEGLQLQERIAEVLPEQAALVAAPITTAAQSYLAQATAELIQTEQFQQAWDAALAAGHRITIGILSGSDTSAIENSDGVVVLNITPIINALIAQGADFLSDLLGRDISAPTVTEDDIGAAVAVLEEQLGTDLPDDFGTVVLFQSEDLAGAQRIYSTAKALIWLAPIAALILIGLALAVSTRRLRTFAAIVVGVALGMLLLQLVLGPIQDSLVGTVSDQGLKGAVDAAFTTVTGSLVDAIVLFLVLGVIAAVVLFASGDSRAAQTSRDVLGQTPGLAAQYRGAFLIGGAVLSLALLAIMPGRSLAQTLVVLLIYAAFALAVLLAPRVAEPAAETPPVE